MAHRSLVAQGAERLRRAGVEHASREARWIWEAVSGRPPAGFTGDFEHVPDRLAGAFTICVDRRAQGEPLAHVLEAIAFRHLVVRSDARALIPRPETEGLVDLALAHQRTGIIADIGTGTGCIALSLASEGDYDMVVAVEQSSDAIALVQLNIHQLKSPVALIRGDLCTMLGTDQLDILVSNPPYLTDAEYDALDGSVKGWEPMPALRSGKDGMESTRQLLKDGLRVVKPGGWLVLEMDCSRAPQVAAEAAGEGWVDVLVKDDLFGRARYLVARRSGL